MTKRLVTFLGTGPKGGYRELKYALGGQGEPVHTRFVARALTALLDCDEVVVLSTSKAWKINGDALTAELAQIGIIPRCRNIPDGKSEAELRSQFRMMHEALMEADALVFDITHGFRAQPVFATTALAVMQAAGDLPPDLKLVYGAMEATDDATGITPIWDLSPFFLQMDLAQGLGAFRHSGHGRALVAALKREGDRLAQRRNAGDRDEYDLSRGLITAIRKFSTDLDTLRLPFLASLGGNAGSAAKLCHALKKYSERCSQDHPALVPLLDDLAGMAETLDATTLFGDKGQAFHRALAELYLQFNRPLEAAAVLREGLVSLHATGPEATDADLSTFDDDARRNAEAAAGPALLDSGIADLRNDLLHGGMRRRPAPADALTRNAARKRAAFAGMAPQPPAIRPTGRSLFVSRHPGAVEWARRQGIDAEAVAHLDVAAVNPGDSVIGTLPIHLVAEINRQGARYLHLVLDLPPEARGKELGADDLERFGARLEEYGAWRRDNRDEEA